MPIASFKPYLLRMARNKSIDYLRSQHITMDLNTPTPQSFIADNDIFESYIGIELQRLVEEKLKDLSPQCQKVFYMSRYENMSYHEIALQMGISENTVKYHIKTALAHLRKELSPYLLTLISVFLTSYR